MRLEQAEGDELGVEVAGAEPLVPRVPPDPRGVWPDAVSHGGPDRAELARLGLHADRLLDFSVNSNPLGASPRAVRALRAVDVSQYPDRGSLDLRAALGAAHDVRPEEVLPGNGSVELIWLLAQVYLEAGDRALIVGPTFGEYEAAIRRQGAEPVVLAAHQSDDFRPRVEDLVVLLGMTRPRVIFLCNPNNPTGQALELEALGRLLRACGEALLVVDEAYLDFADGVPSALDLRRDPRVVVLRSLTKNFGLAGLRLGYAMAAPAVIDALGRAQPPWSVNALAQAAGLAALGDAEHLLAGVQLARHARVYLADGLASVGLRTLPSETNFWLVEVGDAAELRRRLLARGILVRDCASFGLPRHVRLAARPLDACARLVEALSLLLPIHAEREPSRCEVAGA